MEAEGNGPCELEGVSASWAEEPAGLAGIPGALVWREKPRLEGADLQRWIAFAGVAVDNPEDGAWVEWCHPDDRSAIHAARERMLAEARPFDGTYRMRRQDGQYRWMNIRIAPRQNAEGKVEEYIGAAFDCTDAIEAREAHERLRRTIDLALESAAVALLVLDMNGTIVTATGGEARHAGKERKSVEGASLCSIAEEFEAAAPALAKALAGEEAQWEGWIGDRWYTARVSPVRDHEGVQIGVAVVGIDRTEYHEKVARQREHLFRMINGVVGALRSVVELRDPYTAGHQRRVADLALAIAEDLGWDRRRIDSGLLIAAQLHDIGKIVCPAEILSKPARLTDSEMAIIREHSAAGARILRDVEFEGPVGQAVRQHHERLDGSGYPDGLSGDEIIPEARIVGVADIVEAMASHRPYRAALGVPVALQEIRSKRGKLYDPEVVDACLRVFAQEFAFTIG